MIDPAMLAFDIDGVVADTMSLFLTIARDKHGINGISKKDITSYMLEDCLSIDPKIILDIIQEMIDGTHDAPLLPIDGAVDVLLRVLDITGSLVFVTARPKLKPVENWLRQALGVSDTRIQVVATGSFRAKTEVLTQFSRTWFVEDRLETCFLLAEGGINPVLFTQPWNREPHPFKEVDSWKELRAWIRGM